MFGKFINVRFKLRRGEKERRTEGDIERKAKTEDIPDLLGINEGA